MTMTRDGGELKDRCSRCGREIRKDEGSFVLIDPKSEWWLHLCDESICLDCIKKIRAERKTE